MLKLMWTKQLNSTFWHLDMSTFIRCFNYVSSVIVLNDRAWTFRLWCFMPSTPSFVMMNYKTMMAYFLYCSLCIHWRNEKNDDENIYVVYITKEYICCIYMLYICIKEYVIYVVYMLYYIWCIYVILYMVYALEIPIYILIFYHTKMYVSIFVL